MKNIPLYSLVIFPTPEQTALIKYYKQLLKVKIGWYGSANAEAHITIMNFEDETMLALHIEMIREFCKTISPQTLTLNRWNSFGEHTFFIEPNQASQYFFNQLIKDLHQHLGFKTKNTYAHLSIARALNAEKMKAAYELLTPIEINFEFTCDAFYLRKFNNQTKQYSDIVEKIHFNV